MADTRSPIKLAVLISGGGRTLLNLHERIRDGSLNATIHVVVESQIALSDELPVRRTVDRLQAEGLDRHEAIHAVGKVLAEHMHDLMTVGPQRTDPNELYWASLEKLTAEGWRRAR